MKIKQMAERLNSIPVRKKAKRILAVTLAVLMVNPVTGYGVSAHAQEAHTITAFSELSGKIASQLLAVGAEESDINLPDTLSVTLSVYGVDTTESIVKDSQPEEIPTEEVKPDESNSEEPAADESPVDDSSVSGNDAEEPQEDENGAEDNTATDSQATVVLDSGEVPLAATTTGSAISADLDDGDTEQTETETITTEERTLTGITWQINAERSGSDTFNSENAGAVFFYEPVLPEGYTLANGVSMPQIQVKIEENVQWAFSQSTTIDGVEITVKAEKDVFPEGAVLHAEKVTSAEDKEKIQSAVSEEVKAEDAAKTVTKLVSFDITITDAEVNELQPDTNKGEVKVSFAKLSMTENEMIKGNHNIQVFHMNDTLSNAEEIESIVDDKGVVEAVAEHFSIYAITETTDTPDTDLMTTLYIDKGNIIIGDGTVSGFDVSGAEVTAANSNGYIITRAETYSSVSKFTITVSGGTHNIILKDVEFYLNTDISNSPFSIASGAKVNLVLEGTNYLQSRYSSTPAGLHVPEGAELVIAKGSTGSITALGGPGAGIGGNDGEAGGTITINGGTLTYVSGGTSGAGIGGGRGGAGGSITINGGTLTDVRSSYGAGVGGGKGGAGGNIIINGGTINTQSTDGAGIGGGEDGAGGSISINGGTVKATGSNGAGIGGGYQGDGGTITISNGEVTATSNYGAGIGGGAYGWYHTGGTITISGGTVTATTTNSEYGVGIGNGFRGGDNGGTLSSGGNSAYVIANSVTADTSSFNGIIENDGNTTVYGPYTLAGDMTIATGKTMTISSGSILTVPSGKILTVNGTLTNNGTLTILKDNCLYGEGSLNGSGVFNLEMEMDSEYIEVPTGLIYDGMDKTVQAMNSIFVKTGEIGTVNILNTDFQKTVETDDWTKSVEPATVQSAGTYTAKYTNGIQTVSKSFEISKASPIVTISDVTSGEMGNRKATLTIEVAGDENGTIPGGTVKLIDCTSGSDVDIPGATAITMAEGRATFEWTGLANQEYTVKVIYSGDANYNGVTATEFKFDTTKQNQAALNIGSIGTKTYGDGTFTISSTGGNGGGAVTFESSDPTIVSIAGTTATIHKAGTVTITATKATDSTYNEATASVSLTVGKKTLTVKADDKLNVVKGAAIPELTYTATGLVGSDTFTSPSISTTATDTSTVGEYDITISGGTLANADSYAVTYTNGKLTVVNATYTVTVTNGTGGGSYSEGQTVTITADSRGGYTFTGWSSSDGVTFASNTASTTTFTMPGKAVTVTANYSKNSSGDSGGSSSGGSSSGGSSTSTTITTPEKKPNQPVTAVAPVTATAGSNGAASASIPDKAVTDAIAKAQADAKAQGKTANGISVELDVTMPKGTASLTATLTRNSLDSLVSAGVSSLEINGSLVQVSFDKKALTEIKKQSSGNISIAIAPKTNLSAGAKKIIGTRPVYDITVGYGSGKSVANFGGGIATVSIPYTLGKNEAVGGLYAVYVDAKGNATRIAGSAYDTNSGCVIFTTTHFSQYGIGYTAPTAKFTDISTHWAKESVDYVVGRGLLSGTSDTAFSPNSAMTRGMLVTALGRLAGVDTKAYTGNSFTDVNADSAYRPYIEWAYSKGIIQGIGGNQFAPDRAITREEIAVIFTNYAKATGYTLPITREATTYADVSSIGSAYKDAVKAMQQAGIMMGGSDNKFNPKGNATRAEVSSMLNRYIKLTINPDTAQGWTLNDAGQYLYYKDGKALTGTQTIDGVKYFFNTDGTLKTGWVKDGDNWRYYSGKTMLVGFWDLGANGNNKTYYFTTDGLMVSGKWLEIDGKWYYFYTDGSLARSTKIDGYEVDEKGVRKAK